MKFLRFLLGGKKKSSLVKEHSYKRAVNGRTHKRENTKIKEEWKGYVLRMNPQDFLGKHYSINYWDGDVLEDGVANLRISLETGLTA